jgi:hypothetical protein
MGSFIRLLLRPGTKADSTTAAFRVHELMKASTFVAQLARRPLSEPRQIPRRLIDTERRALRAIERFGRSRPGTTDSRRSPQRTVAEVRQRLEACWAEINAYAPEYVALRRGDPATIQQLQMFLRSNEGSRTALISFFTDETSTTAFVLKPGFSEPRIWQCDIGRSVLQEVAHKMLRTFNGAASEFPPYPAIRGDRPFDRSIEWFEALSEPLLGFLPLVDDCEHLCIAAHGPLHLLPMHALRVRKQHLIEQYAVTYCPSLTALLYLSRGQVRSSRRSSPLLYCAGVAAREDRRPDNFETEGDVFSTLRWKVAVDSGLNATRANIIKALERADYIHIACHGYIDSLIASNSGLLVSDGKERPSLKPEYRKYFHRGRFLIRAGDLADVNIRARLITLRSCSTAVQRMRNDGDEFDGFVRALHVAGAKSLITTLWNVDTQSSRIVLRRFYDLCTGQPAVPFWRALQRAQIELLQSNDPVLRHPYHWAPFILSGDYN